MVTCCASLSRLEECDQELGGQQTFRPIDEDTEGVGASERMSEESSLSVLLTEILEDCQDSLKAAKNAAAKRKLRDRIDRMERAIAQMGGPRHPTA